MLADASSAPFQVAVTHLESITVLTVTGEVDLTTAPHLTESVNAVLNEARPTSLIIDLTGVPFFASVGMSVLLDAGSRVADSVSFAVVAAGPSTERPLKLMGLDRNLAMYTDLDTAITSLTN